MEKMFDFNSDQESNFYEILGCTQQSSIEQINTEYKVRALHHHPDKNPGDENAQEKFKELQEAKETLTDPKKRAKYDQWLNSGVFIPWREWNNFTNNNQTVFHWRIKKEDPMLECSKSTGVDGEKKKSSSGYTTLENFRNNQPKNDALSKFRNYQI